MSLQTVPGVTRDEARRAHQAALVHVRASRFTDAEFIFAPSQIAFACMSLAAPQVAASWARLRFPQTADTLLSTTEPIKEMVLAQGSSPDVEAVRNVDRRLKLCKNPEKVVGSRAYVKKQEEAERRAEEKRRRKAAKVRKAMEEGDPFGSELAGNGGIEDDDDDD